MQFIKDGPDIPERLIQEHEEGRVVFFCGAGIAYPAGLPDFKGLVDKIYLNLNTKRTAIEDQAYSKDQYDATLDLLERRIPGGRVVVRTALASILKPNFRRKGATDTHAALLQLAKGRDNTTRIVTTNFDGIFQRIIARTKSAITSFPAPLLPIPKNSRWNGIVYLHGLLPKELNESALNRLVLSSGDFGLAYLTERWASRFVSELFRNYIVCFVGYSINDPVLRYMMDALAADRMLGESTPQAYAFGDFKAEEAKQKQIDWKAKGVVPILYEVPKSTNSHAALHETLKAWADTYRDGVRGRERIVVDNAMTRPMASTQQDNFVGRMLWALSHDSGLPAKIFADHDPVPSLEWLEPLHDRRYRQSDLPRFGVPPKLVHDEKLIFSLAHRPAPYTRSPPMVLTNVADTKSEWDDVMFHLARWLTRHLDDPTLIWWLAKHGGHLDEQFKGLVERRLAELSALELKGDVEELKRIRMNAPMAIPRPLMRIAWRLLLTDSVKQSSRYYDVYRWRDRLKRDGLTPTLRFELREILTPRVLFRQPYIWNESETANDPRFRELVNWEVVLSADHVRSAIEDFAESEAWKNLLPHIVVDVAQLLRDALDLMREMGEADDLHDRARSDLPSITPHWQNRDFHDWVFLIELLRDAWIATVALDPKRAFRIVEDWALQPYPTFVRLTLFAATYDEVVSEPLLLQQLLSENGWWLWAVETQREVMRLLVLRGAKLSQTSQAQLEAAILIGPPRRMFVENLKPDRWTGLVDHMVWLRLAKLEYGHASLGIEAKNRFDALSVAHPDWQLAKNESDEFAVWMGGTGDPDEEDRKRFERVPRKRRELAAWLLKPQPADIDIWYENDWSEVCRDKFSVAISALIGLALQSKWPVSRWREALQVWSGDTFQRRSWRYVAPVLIKMPEEQFRELATTVSWWMEAVAKSFDIQESLFFELSKRFLAIDDQGNDLSDQQPVMRAINHPIGHIARGLLHRWFRRKPEDNQGLPEDLRQFFEIFCERKEEKFQHARVLLATNAIALFRVDPDWTKKHLLPFFSWNKSDSEAPAIWQGFLWSPRLYRPLLLTLKGNFLGCAQRYAELGEHSGQYASLLTFAALDPADTFTSDELQQATAALPDVGLLKCIDTLIQSLAGAGEQRLEYWRNRVRPYLYSIWPQTVDSVTQPISERFARLCVTAADAFPEALDTLENWLQPLAMERTSFVLHLLRESNLASRFPEQALKFMDLLIASDARWLSEDCGKCLAAIIETRPALANDYRYKKIHDVLRRLGRL